jgi:hypothetical protein
MDLEVPRFTVADVYAGLLSRQIQENYPEAVWGPLLSDQWPYHTGSTGACGLHHGSHTVVRDHSISTEAAQVQRPTLMGRSQALRGVGGK